MPKINVYLPDDLADAVRDSGVSVSAVCQRALEDAVHRLTAIRQIVLSDLDGAQLKAQLPAFTDRAGTVLSTAIEAARAAGAPNVGTGHLLGAMIAEGQNLALRVLQAMEIDPAALTWTAEPEPGGGTDLRFSAPAASALETTVAEAISLGHNYVGCEHLLLGLVAEPAGVAGRALRAAGAEHKAVRRTVSAALIGFAHLRGTAPANPAETLMATVRAELRPLIDRITALETRLGGA
jgi:ATP-dependent Clp protease ATP-binding subunit ClpC